jgi:hypothetical protein
MTNYNEERQKEHARNEEIRAKLEKALALLPGWSVKPDKEREKWDCVVTATQGPDPRAPQIWTRFSAGYGDKRIHASGIYPRTAKGEYVTIWYTHEEREARKVAGIPDVEYGKIQSPSITIGPDRTPEQIAKDISRRLLPNLLDYHARVMKSVNADNEYHDTTRATLESIKGAPLDKWEEEKKSFSLYIKTPGGEDNYGSRAEVKASRESVSLDLHDISASEAIMIIRSLKKIRGVK